MLRAHFTPSYASRDLLHITPRNLHLLHTLPSWMPPHISHPHTPLLLTTPQESSDAAYAAKLVAYTQLRMREAAAYAVYACLNMFMPKAVSALVLLYGGILVLESKVRETAGVEGVGEV